MELCQFHHPILDINVHSLLNGDCGSYAIALIELFKDRYDCGFIMIHDNWDDELYHVGAVIDGKIFDGRGLLEHDEFIKCCYDMETKELSFIPGGWYTQECDYSYGEIEYIKNHTAFYTEPEVFIELLTKELDKSCHCDIITPS